MKSVTAVIFSLLLLFSPSLADPSKPTKDPLKPYTKCKPGGLKVTDVDRYVNSSRLQREVTTAKGREKVQVLDGYHILFAFKGLPYPFANVKIEQSDPATYVQDKETIISSLKHLSTSDQATPMSFSDKAALNGFEHYGINRDRIDTGEVLGTHVLFHGPRHLMVTIYFLNQKDRGASQRVRAARKFTNLEEYGTLRDQFLGDYSQCLERVTAQS